VGQQGICFLRSSWQSYWKKMLSLCLEGMGSQKVPIFEGSVFDFVKYLRPHSIAGFSAFS
jgi:hypothetical protein